MGELRFTEQEVLVVLSNEISKAGSLRSFAKANGFSAAFISKVVNQRSPVSPLLAERLGFRRVVYFSPNVELVIGGVK